MKKASTASKRETEATGDRDYWNEFGELLGWRLWGWSYRSGASFFTERNSTIVLRITGQQRDQIMRAIESARRGT